MENKPKIFLSNIVKNLNCSPDAGGSTLITSAPLSTKKVDPQGKEIVPERD